MSIKGTVDGKIGWTCMHVMVNLLVYLVYPSLVCITEVNAREMACKESVVKEAHWITVE